MKLFNKFVFIALTNLSIGTVSAQSITSTTDLDKDCKP